jgi:hypothetical protein
LIFSCQVFIAETTQVGKGCQRFRRLPGDIQAQLPGSFCRPLPVLNLIAGGDISFLGLATIHCQRLRGHPLAGRAMSSRLFSSRRRSSS